MVYKEKIEMLSIAIRNDIPKLMELKNGCKVITHTNENIITIGVNSFYISSDNVIIDELAPSDSKNKYRKIKKKIIGADPMLNDVLQWFLLIPCNVEINISEKTNHICLILNGNQIDIDLTKSYLKDWNENTINLLYNYVKW